ncbi:hypothetical protein VNI00_009014 [Paramarasmius palmivorus]|uniref:HCP-like protein n=1 Tax=Paramarasmius palmivorus TaxID=297713 RepID=A0AAW0CU37_9AGAR
MASYTPTSPLTPSSPLDTLVRRTSTKRINTIQTTPPGNRYQQQLAAPPPSPLLHNRFSVSTRGEGDTSYRDSNISYAYRGVVGDDESVYSTDTGAALRDSWQTTSTQTAMAPTVIVTSPTQTEAQTPLPTTPNFSRPIAMKPSAVPVLMPAEEEKRLVLERNAARRQQQSLSTSNSLATPLSLRPGSPSSPLSNSVSVSPGDYFTPRSQPQVSNSSSSTGFAGVGAGSGRHSPTPSQGIYQPYPSPTSPNQPMHHQQQHQQYRAHSPSPSPSPSPTPRTPEPNYPPPPAPYSSSPQSSSLKREPSRVALPRRPPSLRADSPVSVYSNTYSFYQLDSASPSPSSPSFGSRLGTPSRAHTPTHSPTPPQTPGSELPPDQDPLYNLQLGISLHEQNKLTLSAHHFHLAATLNGGCGVGMLMWGLTLRHGWGVAKDEKKGFGWLRKAAEGAVRDLEAARAATATNATVTTEKESPDVVKELVLAVYEVGQCYFHGWGVAKDPKTAVSYYRVAARLGDPDAQNDLGFCLANGKGCKKDRKEAARWYREAVKQGQSDVGLAWIYKEKFQ